MFELLPQKMRTIEEKDVRNICLVQKSKFLQCFK